MIPLRLFGHDTDANRFREEDRHFHLDRHHRLRLYDGRHGLRTVAVTWSAGEDRDGNGKRPPETCSSPKPHASHGRCR